MSYQDDDLQLFTYKSKISSRPKFSLLKNRNLFYSTSEHVNQGSQFKSKNRSGTAITEGLPWRHPTPDPRGPI